MTAVVLFAALSVSSPAFQQNGSIPPEFTCDGAGKNPALEIGGVPAGAKSLALIVFDPDVPKAIKSDGRYLHWALWNLEPTSAVTFQREPPPDDAPSARVAWACTHARALAERAA